MAVFVLIAVTHFVALIAPGPDFLLILTTLLRSGSTQARWVCMGIVLGNGLILAIIYLCLFGFGVIHPIILTVIQLLGVVYLMYLARSCFRAASSQANSVEHATVEQTESLIGVEQAFIKGLCSSLLNPKNWMFYSSLVVMIYTTFSTWQHLTVVIWMLLMVFNWNLLLIRLFQQPRWFQRLTLYKYKIYAIAALCFAGIAVIGLGMLLRTFF